MTTKKIRAGKNVWVRWGGYDGETPVAVIKSPMRPGREYGPYYPARRVRGDTYEYYTGRSEWEQAANEAMASAANKHFRIRNGR